MDPAVVEAEAAERQHCAAIADDWFATKARKERGGKDVERNFRTYFIAAWGERSINEISRLDVKAIIDQLAEAIRPLTALPPCPTIVLGFRRLGGNTLTECEAIDTFLAKAGMCKEQMQCNVTLDCKPRDNGDGR